MAPTISARGCRAWGWASKSDRGFPVYGLDARGARNAVGLGADRCERSLVFVRTWRSLGRTGKGRAGVVAPSCASRPATRRPLGFRGERSVKPRAQPLPAGSDVFVAGHVLFEVSERVRGCRGYGDLPYVGRNVGRIGCGPRVGSGRDDGSVFRACRDAP